MMMRGLTLLLLLSCGITQAGSLVVPSAYRNVAAYHEIPYKILFAIAMQESQKKLATGETLPWPWTLNVQGKGVFFQNSREMEKSLLQHLADGKTNIDVGLMQINLQYHLDKSVSLIDLIRPEDNLNIAAEILTDEFRRCGSLDWWCAVGGYHSYRKHRALDYVKKVKRWHDLLL